MTFKTNFLFSGLKKLLRQGERHPFLGSFFLGLLLNLALPPFGLWFILPVSLTPFLMILDSASTFRQSFWIGFFYYFGYFLGGLYWISIALSVDWSRFFWLFPFSCLGIPGALALMIAPTVYGLWIFRHTPNLKIFTFAGLTFIFELLRTYLFPQFPWNLLGYTIASSLWFLQSAALFGVFGLSLLAFFMGSFPYLLMKKTSRLSGIFICIFLIFIFLGGGGRLLTTSPQSTTTSLKLIQPNIPQTLKWNPSFRKETLKRLLTLSISSSQVIPSLLVIWPETAVPFFLEEEESLKKWLTSFLSPSSVLITGSGRRIISPPETSFLTSFPPSPPQQKAWNSLFVLNTEGEILKTYDKVHLVPFGEYIPLRKILHALSLSQFIDRTLDFSEGEGLQNLHLSNIPPFSPLICYEIAFPHRVLNPNLPRSEWILNLTNDAWFGTSTGPYQHLQMAQVRACEEGLPIVRVANTGVSAIIDPCGRFLQTLPLNQIGSLTGFLPKSLSPSFYALYGNWTAFFLLLLFGLLLGNFQMCFPFFKKKEKSPK